MRQRIPIVYLVDSAGVNLPYQGGVFPGQYGAGRAGEEFMLFEHPRQERARLVPRSRMLTQLGLHTVADGLAEERVGLLLADEAEQVPRAIRKDDAVDFGVILHGEEELIQRGVRRKLRQRGEGPLRFVAILAADSFTQDLSASAALGQRRWFD